MEGRGWSVFGRKPDFMMEDYWKEEQAKLEPYMVQGKGQQPVSLCEAYDMCNKMGLRVVPQGFTHTYTAGGVYEENMFKPFFPTTGTMGKVPVLFHMELPKVDYRDSPFKVKVVVGDEDKKTIIWELMQEATKVKASNLQTPNLGDYDKYTYRDEPLQFKDNQPSSKSCNLADPEGTNQEPQPKGEWRAALLDHQVYIKDKRKTKKEKMDEIMLRKEDKKNKMIVKMEAGRRKKEEDKVKEEKQVKEEEKYRKKSTKNRSKGRIRRKSGGGKGWEHVDRNSCPTLDSMAKVRNTSLCFS